LHSNPQKEISDYFMATMNASIVQVSKSTSVVMRVETRDSRPSKKESHPGGAISCYSRMALAFPATPTLGASVEGVDRWQCGWVLFNRNTPTVADMRCATILITSFLLG